MYKYFLSTHPPHNLHLWWPEAWKLKNYGEKSGFLIQSKSLLVTLDILKMEFSWDLWEMLLT